MGLGDFNLVDSLLFPTPPSSYKVDSFPKELIWVPRSLDPRSTSPEECVPCLLLQSPSARFIILYFHSNAEDLGRCYTFCSLLRYQFQVHVLAVEYPGYGLCPGGQASEESALENARVAFRFVREALKWPLDGIIVLGRSIGCGPALSIAAANNIYGVILVCPFLSVQQLCRDFVGSLAELVNERFPNQERVKMVKSPLLIIHGRQDTVVPWTHSKALYDACRARKRLIVPDEMHHNTNLHSDTSIFALPMLQFFGLPDYDFTQMRVPSWAFDKRLSPFYEEKNSSDASLEGKKEADSEGLEASAAASPALMGPALPRAPMLAEPLSACEPGIADKVVALDREPGYPFGPGRSRSQVLAAPTPQPMPTCRGPRVVAECGDNGGTTSDGSTATTSDRSCGSAQDKHSTGSTTKDIDEQIQEAAIGAVSRFLQARGLARAMEGSRKEERDAFREDEVEEEVVDVNFVSAARLGMRSSDELPVPPEDAGFLKVPRSRSCKPAVWKTVAEGTKQASWTAAATDILRQSECWWSHHRQESVESTDVGWAPLPVARGLAPRQTEDVNDKLPWSL